MTRTEAIAQAIADELRRLAAHINTERDLRSISFDVKLKVGSSGVRTVIVRQEHERQLEGASGAGAAAGGK